MSLPRVAVDSKVIDVPNPALGRMTIDAVAKEYKDILERDLDGASHILTQAEFNRVNACFVRPAGVAPIANSKLHVPADAPDAFKRWTERNVHAHQVSGYRAVTLSLKRTGQAPGDGLAARVVDVTPGSAADRQPPGAGDGRRGGRPRRAGARYSSRCRERPAA